MLMYFCFAISLLAVFNIVVRFLEAVLLTLEPIMATTIEGYNTQLADYQSQLDRLGQEAKEYVPMAISFAVCSGICWIADTGFFTVLEHIQSWFT